jgi:hypothetical protein
MAAAALVPLLVRRRAGIVAVVTAAVVYCSAGVISIAGGEASHAGGITPAQADTFLRLAQQERVSSGYTGYWDAAPLTWETHFQLRVYPVQFCSTGICPFKLGSDSAWYIPRHQQRTFLITDPSSAPRSLGRPAAAFRVGSSYTFLVYDYDIASRIRR